jgi:hypothetical protein
MEEEKATLSVAIMLRSVSCGSLSSKIYCKSYRLLQGTSRRIRIHDLRQSHTSSIQVPSPPVVAALAGSTTAATSESISERTNVLNGYSDFVHNKRSVLVHPVGLPLVRYFYGGGGARRRGSEETIAGATDRVDQFFPPEIFIVRDNCKDDAAEEEEDCGVFLRCHEEWIGALSMKLVEGRDSTRAEESETELTRLLRVAIGERMGSKRFEVTTVPDAATNGTGNCCLLVRSKVEGRGVSSFSCPLLLLKVGLNNDFWWSKYDQGAQYLQGLLPELGKDRPLLLAVVTLTDPSKNLSDAVTALGKRIWEGRGDPAQGDVAAAKDALNSAFAARIGAFIVVPRKDRRYRIALLWHGQAGDQAALSQHFGRVLGAARLLPAWIDAAKKLVSERNFVYLGPNCSKVCVGEVRHSQWQPVLRKAARSSR